MGEVSSIEDRVLPEGREVEVKYPDPNFIVRLVKGGEGCSFVVREEYRAIASALCRKFRGLEWAGRLLNRIVFLENVTDSPQNKGVARHTNVAKIPKKMRDIIYQTGGYLWEYTVEIYRMNCPALTPAKLSALLYHALRHIGAEGKLVGHDVEEWTEMSDRLGPGWVFAEIPDLLAEGVTWENIYVPMLIPDSERQSDED